jgi:predicted transcriptional regulator
MTSLAVINKETILDQIRAGVRLSKIAADLGISKQAINNQLGSDPEYQAAYQAFHDARLDAAEQALESASEQIDIVRAREVWKAYSWRAERLDKRYASKQELSIEHINMSDAISKGRQRARLIEGEASSVEDSDNP